MRDRSAIRLLPQGWDAGGAGLYARRGFAAIGFRAEVRSHIAKPAG